MLQVCSQRVREGVPKREESLFKFNDLRQVQEPHLSKLCPKYTGPSVVYEVKPGVVYLQFPQSVRTM